MSKPNIAARAGAWSARHRKLAIIGWFVAVILAAVIGSGMIGTKVDTNEGNGQSGRVDTFLRHHFPQTSNEEILVQGRHGQSALSPQFRAAVRDVAKRDRRIPYVSDVVTPYSPGQRGAISKDGHSALVSLQLGTKGNVDEVLAATTAAAQKYPSLRIAEFGDASSQKALNKSLGQDFSRAEKLSLPITLLILVLAFGSLVAAGVPMLLGLTAVGGTLGLIGLVSQLLPMDGAISSVVLLIGLAVGVDYSLFYLRREREERAAGAGEEAALHAAAATSGRAILISGFTVMIAMAGMFFAGSRVFTSFAVGTIMVVAVAMLGSLTVLPAMMSALGTRVDKGRIPLLHRLRRGTGESRLWNLVLAPVMRWPGIAAAISATALVALALPVLHMQTALPGASSLPRNIPIVRTYDRIQKAFPGGSEPAYVGVQAPDVRAASVQRAVAELIREASQTKGLLHPVTVQQSNDHKAETVSIPLAGDGTNATSDAALVRLRALVPQTIGAVPGVAGGRHRQHRGDRRLRLDDELAHADRVRVRARDGVPAAPVHVPLDRDPDPGDRAEPAVGRARRTACSCSSSRTVIGTTCSASRAPARSPRGSRCSCSSCCSACRWTTTCSSSAASARRSIVAPAPARPPSRRCGAPPASLPARRS